MNEIEQIQELLGKYRFQRQQCLRELESPPSRQTPEYWNGKLRVLDQVIEDLRDVVLADGRSGV